MNNLYKSYQEAKEINVALNEAKKMLEFHEDLRNVMADIVLGIEKHSVPTRFVDLYKKEIGIKIMSGYISFDITGLERKVQIPTVYQPKH